jgi:transcriptional antiterminator
MAEVRVSLADRLQRNWFINAMNTMNRNKARLSEYDLGLYRKLRDGYDLVGESLTITRKQMEHIKQVAMELEIGEYRG